MFPLIPWTLSLGLKLQKRAITANQGVIIHCKNHSILFAFIGTDTMHENISTVKNARFTVAGQVTEHE